MIAAVTPMSATTKASFCSSGFEVPCDMKYAPITTPRPTTMSAMPTRSQMRSRPVDGSRTFMSPISCLNCSTRSWLSIMSPPSCAQIGLGQFVAQFGRAARACDPAVHDNGCVVRHAEHGARELLHDEDRHALLGHLGDDRSEERR